MSGYDNVVKILPYSNRYPFCIVWTPIPLLTWMFPFIGHMGICTSAGVIRDFAGPYYVSEDEMAFGNPTRYLHLTPSKVARGAKAWDCGVASASEEYKHRMHNLCCDNCHSHVAMALNQMQYDGRNNYNMIRLCFWVFFYGKAVNCGGLVKQWLPFCLLATIVLGVGLALQYSN